eukprot:c5861_g1_i1.p1 GENE.c5861_g1_i1~~c5861_g1_i1.p1  ORF type:complete len:249 (-),score=113.95 c5861_g1_i1:3-749(-)
MRVLVTLVCFTICLMTLNALTAEEELCLEEGSNRANCARAQCSQHKHCDTCTKDIRCGWCDSEKSCMPGIASGPSKLNCTTWDYAMCSALPCTHHTSCGECAKDPMCGWCSTSSICTEGSARGPVFLACIKKDWFSSEEQCNALYEAPCPCPEADGVTCKSMEKCERNNWIANKVAAVPETVPKQIDDVVWYESVENQVNVDAPVVPVATPTPEITPTPVPNPNYPFPASEIVPPSTGAQMPAVSSSS